MRTARSVLLVALALVLVATLSGCAKVSGIISPITAEKETEASEAFENAGVSLEAARAAGVVMFEYKFQEPVQGMRVWAEAYRDGQRISDPVEINMTNLSKDDGIIAFYTGTQKGETENFSLFASNGVGPDAKASVQLGKLEEGAALSPSATASIETTQITELGEENVLLVMHDGPDLDTEMTNDVNQAQQLISSSTYTLCVYCEFT